MTRKTVSGRGALLLNDGSTGIGARKSRRLNGAVLKNRDAFCGSNNRELN